MQNDKTASMPSESWSQSSNNYDALNDAIFNGGSLDNVKIPSESQGFVRDNPGSSSLDALEDANRAANNQTPQPSPTAEQVQKAELEKLKVNGKEVEFDFSNKELVKQELQKGLAAQQRLKLAKQIRKENERLKAQLEATAPSKEVEGFKKARQLMEKGHHDAALRSIMGEEAYKQYLDSKVNEEVQYRNASPEERASIQAKRDAIVRQLEDDERKSEIERLRAELESQRASVTEQQYLGYLEGARDTYDLGKWITDSEMAGELNESLQLAANNEIIREQQLRERAQEMGEYVPDISSKEIRKIYHKHARRLLTFYKKSSDVAAEQKIEQQASQAKQAAQIASQRNYTNKSPLDGWSGSMEELLSRINGKI